jgi:hypothetical protein
MDSILLNIISTNGKFFIQLIIDEFANRFGTINKAQKRTAIQILSKAGMSIRSISRLIKVNSKTVSKWRHRGNNEDMPRSGAPPILSSVAKDHITELCQDIWSASTRKIEKIMACDAAESDSMAPSRSTIARFIRSTDWGRVSYKMLARPMLSPKNVLDRLRFCSELMAMGYCERTRQGALLRNNILFTDESFVELYPKPNAQNMRIRTNSPDQRTPMNIPKHGLKIMVAGGMTGSGLTKLHVVDVGATVTGEYYRNRILPVFLEASRREITASCPQDSLLFTSHDKAVFMQDGAPAHTAKTTLDLLRQRFPTMWSKGRWPGNSPDLNPIEHLWPILQDSIYVRPRPRNRADLISRVQEAWSNISFELLQRLVHSMPARIEACHQSGGGRSGY